MLQYSLARFVTQAAAMNAKATAAKQYAGVQYTPKPVSKPAMREIK
jgi:hypothetical protein